MKALSPLLLLLALVVSGVFTMRMTYLDGYDQGFSTAKDQAAAAAAKLKSEQDQKVAAAATSAANDLAAEVARGNQLAAELGAKKDELRTTTDALQKEIANVTTHYRKSLEALLEPIPAPVFTVGFVRVWNAANGIRRGTDLPAGPGASGADAPASGGTAADDLDSGLTSADLLSNHIRNGEGYSACRAQLNSLIDWNTSHGHN